MNKRTAIIGASENESRYAYKATVSLKNHGHTVFPLGLRAGQIMGETIQTGYPALENIDTVTLYVGPQNQQPELIDYVLGLHPKRIIFNPGTINPDFIARAEKQGIECADACTLVLLSIGEY